jgi:hypothetical protein
MKVQINILTYRPQAMKPLAIKRVGKIVLGKGSSSRMA